MGEGTLRIHFTSDDLSRTRVAAEPNPFWEMVFSRTRLAEPNPPVMLRPWLARVRHERRRYDAGARVLAALTPSGPYFPDFMTPPEGHTGLDAGAEAIMSTPRHRLTHELGKLAEWSPMPPWSRALADGHAPALAKLTTALRSYHDTAIRPYADLIRPRLEAERTHRAQYGNTDALLHGMAPLMRWRPPVLEVRYGVNRDLHLLGRGLLLVPSFFCRHNPVALADSDLPPTLVYPIGPRSHWHPSTDQPLVALLGATRSTVLAAIDTGTTTTELARRAGTSPASASRHAQVLREAGLVETTRYGTAVLHTLTRLGFALLDRRPAFSPEENSW
jgi:DNA-binding transcriptional ArsR family regulator